MARRKTEQQLKLQLQYAEARKAYVPPTKEPGATAQQRKSVRVQYKVMSHPGTSPLLYTIHATTASLAFFGEGNGEELGLGPAAGDGSAPRGFKPAKIHAVKSTERGTVKHAKDSGRPYISYQPTGGQSSYSAPITSIEGAQGVATLVKSIAAAKKEVIGVYGRIYYTPEFYVIVD